MSEVRSALICGGAFIAFERDLTYQFDIEAGGMEPLFAVVTCNHVHRLWQPAEAEELVRVDWLQWKASVKEHHARCDLFDISSGCGDLKHNFIAGVFSPLRTFHRLYRVRLRQDRHVGRVFG